MRLLCKLSRKEFPKPICSRIGVPVTEKLRRADLVEVVEPVQKWHLVLLVLVCKPRFCLTDINRF